MRDESLNSNYARRLSITRCYIDKLLADMKAALAVNDFSSAAAGELNGMATALLAFEYRTGSTHHWKYRADALNIDLFGIGKNGNNHRGPDDGS